MNKENLYIIGNDELLLSIKTKDEFINYSHYLPLHDGSSDVIGFIYKFQPTLDSNKFIPVCLRENILKHLADLGLFGLSSKYPYKYLLKDKKDREGVMITLFPWEIKNLTRDITNIIYPDE